MSEKRALAASLTVGLALHCALLAAEGPPVTAVESGTFEKAEVQRLQKALGLTIGKPVDSRRLDEGIRAIHDAGRIQTLFVEAVPDGGGIRLVLRGTRLRKLRKVTFTNVEPAVLEDLRRKFHLEEGETADTRVFTQLRERLKAAYEARGYNFADVQIVINDVPDKDDADVEITVVNNQPTLVGRIAVSGAPPELALRIRDMVGLRKGDRFARQTLDDSSDAINRYLRANGYPTSRVEDTQLTFSADRLSVDITIALRLGERFRFIFSGNTVFEDQALRELLTEEILSQSDAPVKIASLIEVKYRGVGFHFCKVTPKSRIEEADKLNVVRFEVSEGSKVIVDKIVFNGAQEAGGDSLETLFYRGASGVLAREIYWEDGIAEAVVNLVKEIQARGYLSAIVTGPKPVFSDDKKGVQLFFDVDLGTRTFLSSVEMKGVNALDAKTVEETMGLKTGEPLNRVKIEDGKKTLIAKYASEGYTDVKPAEGPGSDWLVLSKDKKSAVVSVNIVEGTQYRVGKIKVDGNKKTREEVILREMKLKPGDKLDPVKIRQSEDDIALLGLFSRWEIVSSPVPGSPGTKDLTIAVKETRPGVGELGLGGYYEDPTLRVKAFLGLAYRNLGGLNQTASIRSELALPYDFAKGRFPFVEHSNVLAYRAPYPFDLPFTFSSQIGLDSFEIQALPLQLQTRARIEGKIERRLSSKLTGIYRLYRFERTKTETYDTGVFTLESIGSTGPGVIIDLRDDLFNPTRGSYHTVDIEFASPALLSGPDVNGNNFDFLMALSRNSFYVPLLSPLGFTAFVGFGYAKSLTNATLPTARLLNDLSLGGQSSIRGFDLRQFSPANKSPLPKETAFYNVRLELSSYLFSNLSAALFFDTGQLYPSFRPEVRHDGVGIGFRYKTPVGPVVIDIAQGLGPDRGAVKFYFTVGTL